MGFIYILITDSVNAYQYESYDDCNKGHFEWVAVELHVGELLEMLRKILIGLSLLMAQACWAVDTYNPNNKQLIIPQVQIGNAYYLDVLVTINNVIAVGNTDSPGSFDSYEVNSNLLYIPAVNVSGKYYYNAIVSIDRVISVGERINVDIPNVSKKIIIPDASDYYKSLCSAPSIMFVIPVNLNNDNEKDFIVHYSCNAGLNFGKEITTPTPDALVAQVSQPDGTYKIMNESVFGSKNYSLGGASRKYVKGDINGDGLDDFAFAMNWEDGRSASNPLTNATQPSVLLSTSNGGYRLVRFGLPSWGHSVEIVKNKNSVDVVNAGFTRNIQAHRFQNGDFVDVSSEYISQYSGSWATSFRAINNLASGIAEYFVGSSSRQPTSVLGYAPSERGIQLTSKNGVVWSLIAEFWWKIDFLVDWLSWQLTRGATPVSSINSQQYFGAAITEMCLMDKLSNDGGQILIAQLAGAIDSRNRKIIPDESYSELESIPVNFFSFYDLRNNSMAELKSPIVNEESRSNYNFFDCIDANSDGLTDLIVRPYTRPGFNERVHEGGKPTIYLNNGFGRLVRLDLSNLPKYFGGNELQSLMVDVNNDGNLDMLLFGSAADNGGGNIELYLMSKKFNILH